MKKITPNLMVEDVNRTVEFYKDVLGFEFVFGVPEGSQEEVTSWPEERSLYFAMMKCGIVEIMVQARRSLTEELPELKGKEIGGSVTFYIEIDGIQEWYERTRNKATIIKDLHTTFYGMQEFYIQDCNGYILALAEKA